MLAENSTPFAAIAFEQVHRDGEPMGVITCRAIYDLYDDGHLALNGQQKLILADEYKGPPQTNGLLRVGDLIPFKPNTDITVIGYTYAPTLEPATEWEFGLKIGEYERKLKCHGLRDWIAKKDQNRLFWTIGPTRGVDRVPLDYKYAQGSRLAGDPYDDTSQWNPIGALQLSEDYHLNDDRIRMPMIEEVQNPVISPFCLHAPQGLSPIAPFWKNRQRFAGTYDEEWMQHRKPQLPSDFNYLFYQTASPGLIYSGYMTGDECFTAFNLTANRQPLTFKLPGVQPYAKFSWIDDREALVRLNLDGVHIDLTNETAPWRLDLTWRAWGVICPQFFKIDLFSTHLDDRTLEGMLISNINGFEPPHNRRRQS